MPEGLKAHIQYSPWTGLYYATLLGGEFANCYGQGLTPQFALISLRLTVRAKRAQTLIEASMTKPEWKVGDYARNVESGWLGRIEEISEPRRVWINDTDYIEEQVAKLVGVDELTVMIEGKPLAQSLCEDDVQWHCLDDLEPLVKGAVT